MAPDRAGLLCLVLLAAIILGTGVVSGRGRTDPAGPDQPPSLELLAFLGEWQTDDGQWIGPAELEHLALPADEENRDEPK